MLIDFRNQSRGFLPDPDPLDRFPPGSPFVKLDDLGRDLPSLLVDPGCRTFLAEQQIPVWREKPVTPELLAQLRLYYLRLGFLASGYVNQVGHPPSPRLPANLAVPLVKACRLLARPPILSYDGYALYNWKRFRPEGPIALGNIDTIQNFVHLYDEHWFILVHVEIEALAGDIFAAVELIQQALSEGNDNSVTGALEQIAVTINKQIQVLRRIPEKMAPELYYRTFRPYIRFFEDVMYDGVSHPAITFRGETGAQSSVIPLLVALMKIPHKSTALTDHLADMRNYMPPEHREIIGWVEKLPSLRERVAPRSFNTVLDAIAEFRDVHYGWAQQYIDRWVTDPRGTGGTPYMRWLKQLIDETLAYRIKA